MNNLIDMVLVTGSPYLRSSELSPDEQLIRIVTLSDFFIDVHLVTNVEFAVFIELGGYRSKTYWSEEGFQFIRDNGISEPLYWHDSIWNQPKQSNRHCFISGSGEVTNF